MRCGSDDTDFERHIEYTGFFSQKLRSCSEVDKFGPELKLEACFEDGGDVSLYTYLKYHRDNKDIELIYKKAIDALIPIHTEATEHVSSCPLLEERVFDYKHFRWETEYFVENFIDMIGGPGLRDSRSAGKRAPHAIAGIADSCSKTIVHRDFQSRNVMVLNGG